MISVGLLVPNSGMLTKFGRSFRSALELGIGAQLTNVEISLETGGANAGPHSVRSGLERLINNSDPDLIIAPIGMSTVSEIESLVIAEEVPLVITTLGENLTPQISSNLIRLHSYGLWESAWLTGYRAVLDFGPSVTLVSAFHDSGYGFGDAVRLGAEAAGGNLVYNVVTRNSATSQARSSRAQSFDDVLNVDTDSLVLNYSVGSVIELDRSLNDLSGTELPPMQALAMVVDEPSVNGGMLSLEGIRSFLPQGFSRSGTEFMAFSQEFSDKNRNRLPNVYSFLAFQVGKILSRELANSDIVSRLGSGDSFFSVSDAFLLSNVSDKFDERVFEFPDAGSPTNRINSVVNMPREIEDKSSIVMPEVSGGWFNPYLIA